jgi:hypothetical protein
VHPRPLGGGKADIGRLADTCFFGATMRWRSEEARDSLGAAVPTKFKLAFNLKTAKVLDVAIPVSFLLQADEVIE